jgi:hypothetical protein
MKERGQVELPMIVVFVGVVALLAFFVLGPCLTQAIQHIPVTVPSSHALEKHGTDAIAAANCFNGAGTIMTQQYIRPDDGRKMSFCRMGSNWFVKIDTCDGINVTCFPRPGALSLREVLDYAIHSGFVPPQ